jgi:hypothetical protein
MGCLEFDGQRANGALTVLVFPSSHGHKQKAHTIDTPNVPSFKSCRMSQTESTIQEAIAVSSPMRLKDTTADLCRQLAEH